MCPLNACMNYIYYINATSAGGRIYYLSRPRTYAKGVEAMFQQSFSAVGSHNPMKDFEVQQSPEDSISKIAFSPNANYLVASSWDNHVRALIIPCTKYIACKYRVGLDHSLCEVFSR